MKNKTMFAKLLSVIVLVIGLYMIITYMPAGAMPPTLSGFAFVAIGVKGLL